MKLFLIRHGASRRPRKTPELLTLHWQNPSHPDFHKDLRTDGCIALYCASGARSMAGKRILRQLGYQDVHNIGGLGHWVKAGGKVERA